MYKTKFKRYIEKTLFHRRNIKKENEWIILKEERNEKNYKQILKKFNDYISEIIINGNKNLEFEEKILSNIKNKKIHIFYSKYKIKKIEKLNDKEIDAFAGIGNPSNFFDLLKENNLDVKKTYSFADHHDYSQNDIEEITKDRSTKIVTTEKDFYRMNEQQKKICDFVEVSLEIDNKEELEKLIKLYL